MTWDYRKALQRLVEETSKDTLDVAAALAFLAAGKKPLFYDSMPKIESKPRRRIAGIMGTGVKGKNSPHGIMIDRKESHSATIIFKVTV